MRTFLKDISLTAILILTFLIYLTFRSYGPSIETSVEAQVSQGRPVESYVTYCYAFEQITVSTTAVGFTAANFNPTNQPSVKTVVFTVEANPIRYKINPTASGGAVTSTNGHTAAASDIPWYVRGPNNIRQFRAIRSGASDAILNVSYCY